MNNTDPVIAAGAVCWRIVDGAVRVLLIHRARHGDISFPKGKLDPDESITEAAVREIREETGLRITLGAPLGATEYELPGGRDKIVHYWAAEVDDETLEGSDFEPSEEVASCEWVRAADALSQLTYAHDREVLERLVARVDNDTLRTFAIIALRHGKAVSGSRFDGPDRDRHLVERGVHEAESAARGIAAYGPRKLITSDARRCRETIAPLSELTGRKVKTTAKISQDAWESGEADVAGMVEKRLRKRKTAVLCSHGPVIPAIIEQLAVQTNTAIDGGVRAAAMLETGAYTVVHLAWERPEAGIIAIERHGD